MHYGTSRKRHDSHRLTHRLIFRRFRQPARRHAGPDRPPPWPRTACRSRLGARPAHLCQARGAAAARAHRPPAGRRRAVPADGHAGRLRHGRPRPRDLHPRRFAGGRHRFRLRRALHGACHGFRHRRRCHDRGRQHEADALPGDRAGKPAAIHPPGGIGRCQPAQVPRGQVRARRRAVLQPGSPVRGRAAGDHGRAWLLHGGRRLHAGAVRLRGDGAQSRARLPGGTAAAEGRHRRNRHG
ncbi:hypothetical protein D9M72_300850 [compost metagenome]